MMFEDEKKLAYLVPVAQQAESTLMEIRNVFANSDLKDYVITVDTSLSILRRQKMEDFHLQNNLQEKTLQDPFKCAMNLKKHFYARVTFEDQKLYLIHI